MADFKSTLLTLPDEAFFDLVRNYLGTIRTPFNKHDLVARLEAFLRNDETQERIVSLIDTDDAELLSAIWFLGEPPVDEIFAFFAGRRSYLDLHQRLVNIEDRLLVYRDADTLRISPILKPLLEERVLHAQRLFSSRPATATEQRREPSWVSDALLVSFLSFCTGSSDLFRADGELRKRTLTILADRLPALAVPVDAVGGVPRVRLLVRALRAIGALASDGAPVPVVEGWRILATYGTAGRLSLLAAGDSWGHPGGTDPAELGEIRTLAEAIEAVWTSLPGSMAVGGESVERLLVSLLPDLDGEQGRRARESMVLFGLLVRTSDDFLIPARLPDVPGPEPSRQPLVVQPNYEIVMPQETPFEDGVYIAGVAELIRHDTYPRFEITKSRVAHALHSGTSMSDLLDRLTGIAATVPQNVITALRGWAVEFDSVRLLSGVVLTLDEGRSHIAEHGAVAKLVRRTLAPGIYLIDDADVERLRSALRDAGVEIVPEVSRPGAYQGETRPPQRSRPIDRERLSEFARIISGSHAQELPKLRANSTTELRKVLAAATLSPEQRQELSARIDRKLIFAKEQVSADLLRSEKNEARGLDYVGKVRLIESSIRSGSSYLEVIERGEDGAPIRRLVEPVELKRDSDELVLIGSELPQRSRIELRVRKLGLVRRIRAGLVKRPRHA